MHIQSFIAFNAVIYMGLLSKSTRVQNPPDQNPPDLKNYFSLSLIPLTLTLDW